MAYLGPSLRREKRKERPVRRTGAAVVASLALNALLLWALALAGAFHLPGKVDSARVALAPMSAAQWDANRAIAKPSQAPAAPVEDSPSGRVVELSPEQRASDKAPENSKFLSDRNTRVEKETVSRHAGNYPRPAARPEAGSDRPAPAGEPRSKAGEKSAAPGREGARGERVATARPRGDLRMPELGERGQGGKRAQGDQGADLSLSSEALARIAGGPSMDGTHEGLEEGEETWLQAREFKYATYLNQLKNGIRHEWVPRVEAAVRGRDPDGTLFAYKERTVVLAITLDTAGNVKDLSVIESSSLDFFDRVAVASVRAAQPFPNPPRGMFHGDGEVRFPFMFTLYPANGHASLSWRPPVQ